MMKPHYYIYGILAALLLLSSCSKGDYTRALPSGSTALMYVEGSESVGEELQKQLPIDHLGDVGLDFTQKLYFFELADGNVGLCASVKSANRVENALKTLAEKGFCKEISEVGGVQTAVLANSWVVAYADDAFLAMFSVPATDIQQAKSRLSRYLKQDGERSEKFARLFQKLNAMKTPAAIVGRGQTLLKTSNLDLPRGVEPSQVLDEVGITAEKGVIYARGRRFSFDEKVEKALREHESVFRPIEGRYARNFSSDAFLCVAMNVDGEQFLPMIQNEEMFKMLLASANMAIDMNNIIKSIDGDVAMMFLGNMMFDGGQYSVMAELAHSQWLKDVGYWKTSTPKGTEIKDWGKDSYCYTDGKSVLYFGVVGEPKNAQPSASSQSSLQFFCGNTPEIASSPLQPAASPLSADVVQKIKGSRLVLVVNLEKNGGIMGALMMPFLGDNHTLVYMLES